MRYDSRDEQLEKRDAMSIFTPVTTVDAPPLRIDLLILPETSLLSLASVVEPMRGANRVAGRALFAWRLFSPDGAVPHSSSGLPIAVSGRFDPDAAAEVVIVLSSFNVNLHGTAAVLGLLRRTARRAAAMGGVEAGAWLLARAGLLDGRRATTHWEDLEAFALAHPAIDVRPDRFVVDGPRFTTGGASPALDLMLHLVRERHGYAIALDVASLFIYDQSHSAEAPQPHVSLGRLAWREPRLRAAVTMMEASLSDPLPVADIAAAVGCSARRLEELFKNRLSTGPYGYYLTLRLNAARRLVIGSAQTMAEVADMTGFSSASALARAFRSRFGESPSAARQRADRGGG